MINVIKVLLVFALVSCGISVESSGNRGHLTGVERRTPAAVSVKAVPGENYLTEVRELISSAKSSITVLHFNFFTENGETRKLGEQLKRLKRENPSLRIDVILEGEKDLAKENGAARRNHLTRDFFANSGVNVSFISGLREAGRKPGVTHAKTIVVDDSLLTGSTNLTNTSLTKNNEFNLLITDKGMADFARDYVKSLLSDSTVPHSAEFTSQNTKILTDNGFLTEALRIINASGSGDALNIATYFFRVGGEGDQDADRLLQAMIDARSRGVKVKIYLERSNNPNINQDITKANLGVAKSLSDAGIDVYFDPEDKISHAKMILLDGKKKALLQGSTNLFRGDISENHQVNILVEDPVVIAKAQSWLTAKMAYESTAYKKLVEGTESPKMFRLWFGYAQNRSDLSSLVRGVNDKLIPATTQYAQGRGLDAYLPALIGGDSAHPEIPDEVAVIAYKTADMYDAARMTPPYGPLYGPLHFSDGLFAKEIDGYKSGSAVAKPFDRVAFKVEKGLSAYHINAEAVSWQSGVTTLFVLKPAASSSIEAAAAEALNGLSEKISSGVMDGALFAIDADHKTILAWTHQRDSQMAIEFPGASLVPIKVVNYQSRPSGHVNIGPGEGASVTFDDDLLGIDELMGPILSL